MKKLKKKLLRFYYVGHKTCTNIALTQLRHYYYCCFSFLCQLDGTQKAITVLKF